MKQVPMLDLRGEYEYMRQDIDAAIARCLDHQTWILGPEVKELEDSLAKYLGVRHCIGASSGTEALVLSLRALAYKFKGKEFFDKSDQIITTPFTFIATADAILRCGATPVFVDIDPATLNLDVSEVEKYLQSNAPNVVGILPVYLYGHAAEMDGIMELAKKYKLFVLEDVAQAFGGKYKGKKLGSIGDMAAFSFFPSKNLGGFGDGGLVATNDPELTELVRALLKHGGKDKYNVQYLGYNARLDTLQAAIVLAKFKYIDEFNAKRRSIAQAYTKGLEGLKGIECPAESEDAFHVYHQYTLKALGMKRVDLKKSLQDSGVSTMVYYPVPLHKMALFESRCIKVGPLCEAEKAAEQVLSLPIEPLQDTPTTQFVIDQVKKSLGH